MVQVHSTNQGDPLNNASLWLAESTSHLNGAILISLMGCVLCSVQSCTNNVKCCLSWTVHKDLSNFSCTFQIKRKGFSRFPHNTTTTWRCRRIFNMAAISGCVGPLVDDLPVADIDGHLARKWLAIFTSFSYKSNILTPSYLKYIMHNNSMRPSDFSFSLFIFYANWVKM